MGHYPRAARLCGYLAALFLLAMMLITVADVVLRSLFDYPLFGTFELVELCLVAAIFFALPATFLRDENVAVDVVDQLAPRLVPALRLAGLLLALAFLGLMFYHMLRPALDTLEFGDRTLSLEIPKFVHWLPILIGVGASILSILALLLRKARSKPEQRR